MCNLKALDALNAAGITGSDAIASLDALIVRLVDIANRQVEGLTPTARHDHLVGKVGSDTIRAFSVLSGGAK